MLQGSKPGTIAGRDIYIFPNYDVVFDPRAKVSKLGTHEKFEIFARKTFDPSVLLLAGAVAGASQWRKLQPNYGQGGAAFASRFGAATANIAATNFFSIAVLPTLFHQDPRYYRLGSRSRRSRFWYAVSREVITRQDDGRPAFNISEVLGIGMQTALGNAYYPATDRTFGQTFERYGIALGVRGLLDLLKEFAPPKSPPLADVGQPNPPAKR